MAINPDNADAHFNLAMLVGPSNQPDAATRHLTRAIDINPRNADGPRWSSVCRLLDAIGRR